MQSTTAPSTAAWMSSWWDKYFAPGDIRAQSQQLATPLPTEPTNSPTPVSQIPERIDAAHRARRQNALLFGGLAFTALSAFVTRRALRKKYLAMYPTLNTKTGDIKVPHFTQSNTSAKAEGGLDAAEALFIATLSVFSVFMTGTGAFMKWYDIADVEDLRDFVREGVGYDVYAGDRDTEADKEIEGWMAEILARKDGVGNLQESVLEKMAELQAKEMEKKGEKGGVLERVKQLQKENKEKDKGEK